jgi:hypothetical protein
MCMRNMPQAILICRGETLSTEPILSLFVSFLVISAGVLGYSLLKAEK